MKARFIGHVLALTFTAASCAGAQSAVPPVAPLHPFSGISSITTLDNHGAVTSTTCCELVQVDADGRRLTAHIDSASFDAPIRRASITDPIALKMITIDHASRTANVTMLRPGAVSHIMPSEKPFTSEDNSRGDVGEKIIDGIRVHGYVWVAKAPDGAPARVDATTRFNPAAYPITNEWWWSPELHVFPLITEVDANGNKWIQKYEKFDLRAPALGDFAVPQGFRVTTVNAQPDTR
jgi:hypothetical protein